MVGMLHPELLSDGVVDLRRWHQDDASAVQRAQDWTVEETAAWVTRQQTRPAAIGVSCAVALSGRSAAGYVGLIRRPRVEMGVLRAVAADELVYHAHQRIVGIGYWIAPDAQRQGLATRATTLRSRWALQTAGVNRVEALLDPRNVGSRRVVEKSGFHAEGHLRSYLELDDQTTDALVFSLLASDL
jgi:RimJ/RimL family protein N-acetyltransferase